MRDVRLTFSCWLLVALLAWPNCAPGQIEFADNQADRFRLWNADYYELGFRKADGRLLYIVDKTTGQQVSPGNVHGPWVLQFSDGTWLDGEYFSPTNPARRFTYAWDAQSETLTLTYDATGTHACDITITINPTDGPEVDSTLAITNQSGHTVELLAYPVQLSFLRSTIEGVYVPYMEGMRLLPSFFASHDYQSRYPGQMFADFAYTELSNGSFAVYCVHDPQAPLWPSEWLILRDGYAGGVGKYHHDYEVAIGTGQQWTSPVTVLSIGSSLAEAMDAYWTRNGHDAIPTLEEKLGAPLFDKLAGAVLLKRDFLQGGWTFASFQSFMSSLPEENLLHFVAFWPVGFDEHYPDYLPPHPALGSLSDFQNLVAAARAAGHLVMPYTNPTWWDDQSPTLANLGTGIVARDRSGALIYEYYGSHGGYVVSPYAAEVIARQDQTRDEFTITVPCDLLFEDQVGARQRPEYAAHPDAPDPSLYTQGLVEVAERSASRLPIMTEGGFDRLTWHESGFCNSHTIGWHWWPESTYTAYPLAPLWAHENLYFNAHNLANEVMANDLPLLTYYLSMGYSLSHDLASLDADWLAVLDCYQKHLIAHLVGQGMSSFEYLPTDGRTRTTFGNGVIITANRTGTAMTQDGHVIAPQGFLAQRDGHVLGGVLTTLNGQMLAGAAPHYLVFDQADYRIEVHQPRGDDTALTLSRPATWTADERIQLIAVAETGFRFDRPLSITASTLQFTYYATVNAQPVSHYELTYCRQGDADCNGLIDAGDLDALGDCLSGPGVAPLDYDACLATFDCEQDADVDLRDVDCLQRGL